MTWRHASIGVVLGVAAYAAVERWAGPAASPLPGTLPHVVRRPPPGPVAGVDGARGVNPGDEVRRLHARGITGKNVGVAIVDSFLYTEHGEYRDRLRWYDELDGRLGDAAGWHGTAVASIAVGKSFGVAPEADLYYVGLGVLWSNHPIGSLLAAPARGVHSGQHAALAIRRILAVNRRLEPGRKIRVIAMAMDWGPEWLTDTAAAVEEARRDGIFVAADDLNLAPYGPVRIASADAPGRHRTAGAAESWSIAYWAGRFALACQEDASMTTERFRINGTPGQNGLPRSDRSYSSY